MLSQKDIFLAAADIPDLAERSRYLDEACGDDAALRGRVEALLNADAPEAFLAHSPVAERGDSIGYFGDYVLLSEIARGSSGVVFRARQTSLNRVVALKMLRDTSLLASPADEKRFRAEAEAAAGLDHPGIVPIYEVGQHAGQRYFSMKLIDGGTLHFRGGEFREPRLAAALMGKVARAVHHAHQHGILHRDLKPGNILLDRDGEPHVVDFGIAQHIGVDSGLTQTGQIIGTPHYMAPEQARGENRALTPAADIYSLGAILYELLAGRKPFDAGTMLTLLKQVTEQPPAPLRLADRDLEHIVMRCLEKKPAARYGSAAELADDLDRWLHGEAVNARPVGIAAQLAKWMRRRPLHAALAAVVVVLALSIPITAVVLQRRTIEAERPGAKAGRGDLPASTKPQLDATVRIPYKKWKALGHTYQFIAAEDIEWDAARAEAEKLGGHLVTITTPEEDQMLWDWSRQPAAETAPPTAPNSQIWIGASRQARSQKWKWVTGEPFVFEMFSIPVKEESIGAWACLYKDDAIRDDEHWNEFLADELREKNLAYQIRGFIVEWDE